jgi:hypothetical protein
MTNHLITGPEDIKQLTELLENWLPEKTVRRITSDDGLERLSSARSVRDLIDLYADLGIDELSGIVELDDPYLRQARRIVDEMYNGHVPSPTTVHIALTAPERFESPGAPSDGDDADDTLQGTTVGAVIGAVGAAVGLAGGAITGPIVAAIVIATGALAGGIGGSHHD